MSQKATPTLLSAMLLLAGCSTDRAPTATREPARAPLPTADAEAIDVDSLEGRFTFGAGSSLEGTEVYTIDADGSGLTRLTDNGIPDFDPSWSPDGSAIVFRLQQPGGNDEIFVMNTDGTGPRNLTNEPAVDWGPEWSPDGKWIVFNSGRDSSSELHGFVTDPSGKSLRRLADDLFVEYPAWSPDGKRIAFMSQTWEGAGGNYEIFVMNAEGSGVTQLTDVPGEDAWPAWSPDGTKIVFSSQRDDCAFNDRAGCEDFAGLGEFHDLYVMNADGSDQTRITDVFGQFPVWSPDGEFIAFTPAPGGIYVMRPDGSDLTLIETPGLPGEPEMPDWVA